MSSPTLGAPTMDLKISGLYASNMPTVRSFLGSSKSRGGGGCYYTKITLITNGKESVIAEKVYLNSEDNTLSVSIPTIMASPVSILKFSVSGQRQPLDKHMGDIELTVDDLLKTRNNDGEVQLDITDDIGGKLCFKVQSVVDGTLADMEEAVPQALAAIQQIHSPASIAADASGVLKTADSFIHRVSSFQETWGPILEKLSLFQNLGDSFSEIHPYAKLAWNILSFIPKEIQNQVKRDKEVISLAETMDFAFSLVKKADDPHRESRSKIILQMMLQTTECAMFLRDYVKVKAFWKRAVKGIAKSPADQINEFRSKFVELQSAFQVESIVEVELAVLRVIDDIASLRKTLKDHVIDERLKDMRFSKNARFNREKICLPNTRIELIDKIIQWTGTGNSSADSDELKTIFLLHGMAGTGKSTIANTISVRLSQSGRLGGSFFFSQDDKINQNAQNMFSTLARSLASLDRSFKIKLFEAVEDPALCSSGIPSEQYEEFILEPMQSLACIGEIIIVIDALDECDDRSSILNILAKGDFPENIRFIITTRPEADIMILSNSPHVLVWEVNDPAAASIIQDVQSYIKDHLKTSKFRFSETDVVQLAHKADGLFQWAATACAYLTEGKAGFNPRKHLELVLSSFNGLDGLYTAVLKANISDDPEEAAIARSILAKVLAAVEPLSMEVLREMCFDNEDEQDVVDHVISSLGSVLTVHGADVICPVHTSFRDYLNQSRSQSFFVDISKGHQDLAMASLKTMNKELCFNICQIQSSYMPNSLLTPEQLSQISPGLSYSCQFWGDHLQQLKPDSRFQDEVLQLLKQGLLFWLEVLSVKQALKRGLIAMQYLHDSKQEFWNHYDIQIFAKNTIEFIQYFAVPISLSAPHIYLSGLALIPDSSIIWQQYTSKFCNLLQCFLAESPRVIQGIIPLGSAVICTALSPDGKQIVSGLYNQTICMWDAETLQQIGQPLQGHTGRVTSVAFSPNGKQFVSGSADQTICMWDAKTLQQIGSPLQGHTRSVQSIAFSPDGKKIVTGSEDKTICVWNAETLQQIGQPLKGHKQSVQCIAFSPNGEQFVSGSFDGIIHIWNAETLQLTTPYKCHKYSVQCIAFSPDGKKFVSGSSDKTVCMWDAEKQQTIGKPLQGHKYYVQCVAFSPDGKQFVSGSDDRTIRIWDAIKLQQIGQPLEAHTLSVKSVAYSPNGRQIISSSSDETICIWDVETLHETSQPLQGYTTSTWIQSVAFSFDGKKLVSSSNDPRILMWDTETLQQIGQPLKGHKSSVHCVAFSPDGRQVVSGSADKTVRMWDVETLQEIGQPLQGHTDIVKSVAFSPNEQKIISGSADKTICMWDADTLHQIGQPLKGHTGWIHSVAFSPDGKQFVSGSADQTICMWDAKMLQQIGSPLRGHTHSVQSVAFSPDGKKIVTGSEDKTICVWNAETLQQIGQPLKGHKQSVQCISFSPDGRLFASGSDDKTICMWDAETLQQIGRPLQGHIQSVQCVAFSPNGKQIASGAFDRTIHIWDAEMLKKTGQPLQSNTSVVLSPDTQSNSSSLDSPFEIFVHNRYLHPTVTLQIDGWVLGPHSEPIFWVPAYLRDHFPDHFQLDIIGGQLHRFDASHFVHGIDWIKCIVKDTRK